MSNAIVIFSTIIFNICEPQICFEAQNKSYVSNGFNEIILDSCEANVVQDILTTSSYCYQVPSSQDDSKHSQESICNMNSVEETYNEIESEEISEEKKEGDGGAFLLLILFAFILGAVSENESGHKGYRRVYKRTRYIKQRYM
ncbi:uncharacterized protein LOC126759945 [Bactrocera neohumeralis]|uniref:uncharacterized protein LOC126759945 n=1 Tax=Bactrocera neohumeralis TaxID=98809 RepID=UPI002165C973|nr:uncharacterized protein LOC126759945 [Bactrocera neohumeralis]